MANLVSKAIKRVYPPRNMLFFLQRQVLKPSARKTVSGLIAGRLPKAHSVATNSEDRTYAETLNRDGFAMLPNLLSASQIADVFAFLSDKVCFDRWKPASGTFHISQAPANCHTAPYLAPDIANCPHLLEAANHPLVLNVISRVLGCKPTLSNLGLWWSLSGHSEPEEAENFHRDVDEWHFIKLFVYLTDVTEETGPHVFIKGSPADSRLLPIRRYTDEEVTSSFGSDQIVHFTGKAGTNFLENTFGLHKGQLPVSGNRLLFQSQYSLMPIHLYKYTPVTIDAARARQFDPYINRLYVSFPQGRR